MKAVIILYELGDCSGAQRVKIQNSLYGYIDYSNGKKYKYQRDGIVNKFPHLRLSRGGIILGSENKKEVILLLERNNAKIRLIPISIAANYLKNK